MCATAGVFRSYLAVAGGFRVTRILNSTSAHVALAGLVPEFAPLKAGAVLTVGLAGGWAQQWLAHLQKSALATPAWGLTWALQPTPASRSTIRLLPGDPLLADAYARMCRQVFKVSPRSNRMGMRLEGPALPATQGTGVSSGVCTGAIQLLPDGPTTGVQAHRVGGGACSLADAGASTGQASNGLGLAAAGSIGPLNCSCGRLLRKVPIPVLGHRSADMSTTAAQVAIMQGLLARQDEQLRKLRLELAQERDQNNKLRMAVLTLSEELRQAQEQPEAQEPEIVVARRPAMPPVIKVLVAVDTGVSPVSVRQYQEISHL